MSSQVSSFNVDEPTLRAFSRLIHEVFSTQFNSISLSFNDDVAVQENFREIALHILFRMDRMAIVSALNIKGALEATRKQRAKGFGRMGQVTLSG